MNSGVASSSVVVVEIDTRKGSHRTVFESSVENQSEHAKQFWKTLNLAPHIESSLYSKEILQQIKPNTLKPIMIDNSRKVPQPDPKTESYLKNVQVLNQIDEIMKIQKKASRIDHIRLMHRNKSEKSNQQTHMSRTGLIKSESESKWLMNMNEANEAENNKINDDEYEIDQNDLNDEDLVKDLN